MDEVRTSIEKMLDSYDSPNSNRFSNSFNNSSANGDGKKTSNDDSTSSPHLKRRRDDNDSEASFSYSNISCNSTLNSSNQWEMRILKADLIEANTKVMQLKKELEDRIHLHKTLEQLYDGKLQSSKAQLDASTKKNEEYGKMVKYLQKKISVEKDNVIKIKNDMMKQSQQYEATISSMRNQSYDTDSYARESVHGLQMQLDMYKLQLEHAQGEMARMREELNTMFDKNTELTENLDGHSALVKANEEQKMQLETAERKVKELEAEIVAFGEWKKLEDVFQVRLAKTNDLERECERLMRDNKNLSETIGNKLLLEEQVHDLKTRLENQSQKAAQTIDLETKLNAIEQEIKGWKKMTAEFCAPNTLATPQTLRAYIDRMQKQHLVLADGSSTAKLEKSVADDQMHELRTEHELSVQKVGTLTTALRNYKNALHRLQKRITLITSERDCFKKLLENYERDLTITNNSAETHGDNEVKARLDMLERSLVGYKELCSTLEKELVESRSSTDDVNGGVQPTNDYIELLHKQMEDMRRDNERLQRRKDDLEEIFEQANMKQAYNIGNGRELKVVHLAMNPADEAAESYTNELDKLRAEIERYKRKIRKMEEDQEDLTTRLNETRCDNTTINIQEISNLRSKIQSLESKQQHYKDLYRAASSEFRDVVYMLFGYRVDRVNNINYHISSMFAENEDDYLHFRMNDNNELDMLETPYSATLSDMVGTYLVGRNSMPAFLSTLTMDLYNRTTVAVA